ncbi:MAG: hypothetical protein V1874_11490 [Spirochaetota bacterium]
MCSIVGLLWWLRGRVKEFKLVILGLVFLFTFLVIRIVSINHVGHLLGNWKINYPFWINHIVELGGIVLIGAEAVIRLNSMRQKT